MNFYAFVQNLKFKLNYFMHTYNMQKDMRCINVHDNLHKHP